MSIRGSWLLLLIVVFALSDIACSKKEDKMPEVKGPAYDNSLPGEDGMKNTVKGYLQAVMDAHLSDLHMKFIRKYATEDETRRVFIFISTDREKGVVMAMRLNRLVFDNISSSDKEKMVDTTEHWDFHYLDIKTSKPVEPVREIRYKLRYILEKEEGKWLVVKLREREKQLIGEYSPPRWSLKGK